MALGPINYQMQIATPFESVLQGMRVGAQMADIEAARQEREAKIAAQNQAMQQQRDMQQAVAGLMAKQNPTFRDYQTVAMMLPKDQAATLLQGWEKLSTEQKGNDLVFGGQVLSAVNTSPDVAVSMLRERATAERNRGREDQAKAYDTWATLAERDPDSARVTIGTLVAQLPGGDKVIESVGKVEEQRRAQKLFPLEEAIKRATAGKTGFEATKAGYDAGAAYLELQYKPQALEDAIKKRAADLKLTDAQTQAAVAAANASAAAARKSGAEASAAEAAAKQAAAGVLPAEKRPEAEAKLRKEYNDNTKGFTEVRSAFDRVNASQDNAVGDLSLIFGYMKMLDPGSVVREGEFANAQNAAGVPERVLNMYNRVLSGERLNKSQRESFKGQAGQLMEAAGKQEKIVRDGITRIAGGLGLNTSNIFYEAEIPLPGGQPAAIPGAAPGQRAPVPAAGQRNVTVPY